MLKEHGLMSRLMPVMVTRVFYLLEMASSTQIGLSYRPKSLKDRIETLNDRSPSVCLLQFTGLNKLLNKLLPINE